MQSITQAKRAYASAQSIFDMATPPCEPDPFLESDEGKDWLDSAVRGLVQGDPLVIKSRTVSARVEPCALHEAIAARLADNVALGFELEEILSIIAARGHNDYELYRLLQNLFGLSTIRPNQCHQWSVIHDLAEGLISPLADAYCQAESENSEDDCYA